MVATSRITRRRFAVELAGATLAVSAGPIAAASRPAPFALRYILGSSLFGYMDLEVILPEVKKTGADAIDIWPKIHGNQREQLDEMGEERFAELLKQHGVTLGCITQYKLGPFALQDEMRLAQRLGCRLIVTGAKGPRGLKGEELKKAVGQFVEKMKPHLETAAATGVTIAIENHGNNLIESPDSMKWLVELCDSPHLALAFAPYHLPQDPELLARLIRDLGSRIAMFYAWQHGMGCMTKLPKDQELLQMPGRGPLDFKPMVAALRQLRYAGWTEIFMHPVPRGVPILPTPQAITAEVNRARRYLEGALGS